MEKLDLTKKYKTYYSAKAQPEIVTIEPAQFISITGKGDPSGKEFAEHVEALYSVAYTIKFNFKARQKDFVVSKLEGLWWFDEKKYRGLSVSEAPQKIPRKEWEYRLLLRMPDFVRQTDLKEAVNTVLTKKQMEQAREIIFYEMEEGRAIQVLHVGPFDREPETLKRVEEFIRSNKLEKNGLHHEIYLSDFRKTAPSRLKTILREPVK